ncbi:MAG: helix-turn-helix domain-containing protein [Microlunatus sp.]|nr:helix-turn-helix domain-containing protein [Microlunatus sp.]
MPGREGSTGVGTSRQWLTIREFASISGVSSMTIYRLIEADEFPAVRVGRRLFVPARLLDDLANAAVARGRVVTAADWQEVRE